MLKLLLLLSFLCYSLAEDQQGTFIAVDASETNKYRALKVEQDLLTSSLSIGGLSYERDANGELSTASVDAVVFKLQAGLGKGCEVYGAAANLEFQWGKTEGGGAIGSIKAALAEAIMGISHVCAYEEHNGDEGFQYDLGTKMVCPGDNGKDCVVDNSCFWTKDLIWSVITKAEEACPATGDYEDDCTCYTFTTIGSKGLNQVFTITLRTCSQNVDYKGKICGPDTMKIDWDIKYPWSDITYDPENAKVTVICYNAGRAHNIEKTVVVDDEGDSFTSEGKTTVVSWAPEADASGVPTTTITSDITDDELSDYSGTTGQLFTDTVVGIWKLIVPFWKAFGWRVRLVIFSWDVNKPELISYDPAISQTNFAITMGPGLMLPLFICIVHYFYRNFH